MKFLIIIFASPIYFAMRSMWGAFTLNLALYITGLLTVVIFGIGVFFWMLAVGHAGWHLRAELMEEQATMMAEKMATALRDSEAEPTDKG